MIRAHVFVISAVLRRTLIIAPVLNMNKTLAALDSHYYFYFLRCVLRM